MVKYHKISEAQQVRRIVFWWDLDVFDEHEMRLRGLHGLAVARLAVFQEHKNVVGQPTTWSFIDLLAPNEATAFVEGANLMCEHCARLTILTGVPFCPEGDLRLARLAPIKHIYGKKWGHFELGCSNQLRLLI